MYQIKMRMPDNTEKLAIWEKGKSYIYLKKPGDTIFHNINWVIQCSRFRWKKGILQYIKTHDVAVYTKQPSVNAEEEIHYLCF